MRNTTTVVIGAGHCGLAMSRCLAERSVDHVVLERGEVAQLVAHPAVGLAAPAHPELDDPAAGLRLPGRRPGRLPRASPEVVRLIEDYATESAAPVLTGTTVTVGPAGWSRLRRPHRPGQLARADRGGRDRRDRGRQRAGPAGRPGSRRDHDGDRRGLPQPRPAPGRRRAGRRRLGQRGPDRRGAAALRAAGDAGRRRARADAADLPGPRHPVVDGRVGPARRALRRGAGPGPGAQPAVDAAGRLAAAGDGRPQRVAPAAGCGWSAGSSASATGPAQFSGSLPNVCALADLKLGRLLDTLDAWADRAGIDAEHPPQRFAPTAVPGPVPLSARLGRR